MLTTPEDYLKDARARTDIDLEIRAITMSPATMEAITAKYELARREKRRTFFLRDIVAWIALALSLASIYFSHGGI